MTAQADWRDQLESLFGGSQEQATSGGNALAASEVAAGLKQALAKGAGEAVTKLGRQDGFWAREAVRIPLPGVVQQSRSALRLAGYGPQLEQFQLTMNRAAEQATAEVGGIVRSTVEAMTVRDAYDILQGPSNAATQYLRENSGDELFAKIEPIVAQATSNTGVTAAYKNLVSQAGPLLSLAVGQSTDLDTYVTNGAMDGLFTLIAQEEAEIRANPTARGTELLRKVFGNQ